MKLNRLLKRLFKPRKMSKKEKVRFVQTLNLNVPMNEYVGRGVNE